MPAPVRAYTSAPGAAAGEAAAVDAVTPVCGEADGEAEVTGEVDAAGATPAGCEEQAPRSTPPSTAPATPSTVRRRGHTGEVTRPTVGPAPARAARHSPRGVEPCDEIGGGHGGAEEQSLADVAVEVGEDPGR